jgi:transposase
MGRKFIEVKTLHRYTIEELQQLASETSSKYTSDVLMAVIMRYNGVDTTTIMNTLGKSRPTITRYINQWNDSPLNIIDQRGGNIPSELTVEIVNDIKDIVVNKKPSDFNYAQNVWTSALLAKYIEDKYGSKYSSSMIRKLLKKLGFSYKRGLYKPTKADPELQKDFKKNEKFTRHS